MIEKGTWLEFIGGECDGTRLVVVGDGPDPDDKVRVNTKSFDGRYTIAFMRLPKEDLEDRSRFRVVDGPRYPS
jgi:hypothetical protein